MSTLWKVESNNATDGYWEVFVKCESPFEAMRLATERKSWNVLDGISVKGVLNFIEPAEPAAPASGIDLL